MARLRQLPDVLLWIPDKVQAKTRQGAMLKQLDDFSIAIIYHYIAQFRVSDVNISLVSLEYFFFSLTRGWECT